MDFFFFLVVLEIHSLDTGPETYFNVEVIGFSAEREADSIPRLLDEAWRSLGVVEKYHQEETVVAASERTLQTCF